MKFIPMSELVLIRINIFVNKNCAYVKEKVEIELLKPNLCVLSCFGTPLWLVSKDVCKLISRKTSYHQIAKECLFYVYVLFNVYVMLRDPSIIFSSDILSVKTCFSRISNYSVVHLCRTLTFKFYLYTFSNINS